MNWCLNEVPSIGHLCVFGCGAYVHIPAEVRKDKLAPKGELRLSLGYVDGVKGYLFMQLSNNILFFWHYCHRNDAKML